jgi:hypothetical protein
VSPGSRTSDERLREEQTNSVDTPSVNWRWRHADNDRDPFTLGTEVARGL